MSIFSDESNRDFASKLEGILTNSIKNGEPIYDELVDMYQYHVENSNGMYSSKKESDLLKEINELKGR